MVIFPIVISQSNFNYYIDRQPYIKDFSQVLHDNMPQNGSKTLYLYTNVENIKALILKIELSYLIMSEYWYRKYWTSQP